MDEFELIKRFLQPLGKPAGDVRIGIGDDGAVVVPPPAQELVVVVDTLVEGVHFPVSLDPADLGYRAVAVNLSDLAAMGSTPRWATLALTMPAGDPAWLRAFAQGLGEALANVDAVLVGGDTTRGPLCVTVQLIGCVPAGTALTRGGAHAGDVVFVSGTLGDARAGLDRLQAAGAGETDADWLIERFARPTARLALGAGLRGIASSAIDISDGLIADLGHIATASGCGAQLAWGDLPLSPALLAAIPCERARVYAATGGDDYELCFTVPAARIDAVHALGARCACPITRIGVMTADGGIACVDASGAPVAIESPGFRHF